MKQKPPKNSLLLQAEDDGYYHLYSVNKSKKQAIFSKLTPILHLQTDKKRKQENLRKLRARLGLK